MPVDAATPGRAPKLVFSGLDSSVAGEIEGAFAQAGPLHHQQLEETTGWSRMCRCSSPRSTPSIWPCSSRRRPTRGWKGRIVTNPNCSTIVLSMALAPLRPFGLKSVMITTLQAISGAGYPGVASWDILGNVIPFIDGEEQKIETETKKILGCYGAKAGGAASRDRQRLDDARRGPERPHRIDCGRLSSIVRPPRRSSTAFNAFKGKPQQLGLPSAPAAARGLSDRTQPAAAGARRRSRTAG